MFTIRQHSLQAEIGHIGQVEANLGHVVVVIDPWDEPVCLSRVWVLYEILHSLHPGCEFNLTVPPEERVKFVEALSTDLLALEAKLCSFGKSYPHLRCPPLCPMHTFTLPLYLPSPHNNQTCPHLYHPCYCPDD
jgi:hypothetical protein